MKLKLLSLTLLCVWFSCKNDSTQNTEENEVPKSTVKDLSFIMTKTYPHDPSSFTEGLLVHDGKFYESTAGTPELPQTRSLFGELNMNTGKIDPKVILDEDKYFGEGISFLNGKVYQLTWQSKIGFIYDAKSYKKLGEFTIPSEEGWGMTTDGKMLIMSDGTSKIKYLDPSDMQVKKVIDVTDDGYVLRNINELEYVDGFIYANLWMTNTIVKIDPATGKVIGKLDLSPLAQDAKNQDRNSKEMNGIAWDPTTKKFYVTGKMWPTLYEIEIKE